MNRILFEEHHSVYELDPRDPRFEHVRGVLRMREGDRFDVGVINGPAGKATIESLEKERMNISVEWGERPPVPPPVYLLVGMCRPATARKILTTAPTLGVRGIVFSGCGRSDPAYGKSSLWTGGESRQRLIEGAEQAFDTFVPDLRVCEDLPEAVDFLKGMVSRRFMLDVYEGARPLSLIEIPKEEPVCLAVGPERGWNTNDRKFMRDNGFDLVSLNNRVLRVETAVAVGLTLMLAAKGVY
jgi:RsmE family RNA methyltransferase